MPRGRTPGFRMDDSHRVKIRNSNILTRLIKHAEGAEGFEMTQTQVTAALALLKKVLPDLQSIEHSGPDGGPIDARLTIEKRIIDP
jgi:hypothetical protein